MEAQTNTRRRRLRAIDLPRDPLARAALLEERKRQARRAKSPHHYTGLGIRESNVPRALGTTAKTISSWLALPPEALKVGPR